MKNTFRIFGLLLTLTLILMGLGYVVGYLLKVPVIYTVGIAFTFAVGLNFISYWYSHKWVLRMYGAETVSEADEPKLHNMINTLASKADLPKPEVAIIDEESPNAFATGRNPSNSVVAVTKGAKEKLSKEELEGILSHELAHIKNRDMLINTMAAMIARAIAYVSIAGRFSFLFGGSRRKGGLLALFALILAPIAAMMIRLAVSRNREYGADEGGAEISGEPAALAKGLKHMQRIVNQKENSGDQTKLSKKGNPTTSHLFI